MLMTKCFFCIADDDSLCSVVSGDLDNISSWVAFNKLSLNVSKGEYVLSPAINQ